MHTLRVQRPQSIQMPSKGLHQMGKWNGDDESQIRCTYSCTRRNSSQLEKNYACSTRQCVFCALLSVIPLYDCCVDQNCVISK